MNFAGFFVATVFTCGLLHTSVAHAGPEFDDAEPCGEEGECPDGQQCYPSYDFCFPEGSECESAADCGDGVWECWNGWCDRLACQSDDQCAEGEFCELKYSGVCKAVGDACVTDVDCGKDSAGYLQQCYGGNCEYMDCDDGECPENSYCDDYMWSCLSHGDECETTADCPEGTGECIYGDCEIVCEGDSDCPEGMWCWPRTGFCDPIEIGDECETSADCPPDSDSYNCEDGWCVAGPVSCEADDACPGGWVCDLATRECRAMGSDCEAAADCGEGAWECYQGRCQRPWCETGQGPEGWVWDADAQECVDPAAGSGPGGEDADSDGGCAAASGLGGAHVWCALLLLFALVAVGRRSKVRGESPPA